MLSLENQYKIGYNKSDFLGMLASGLCLLHCLVTPFLFIAKTCSSTCCAETPIWWKTIDVLFLGISFFAVLSSTNKSNKTSIKVAMWVMWSLLCFIILNEYLEFVQLFEQAIYIPTALLIALHLYSLKFCQCKKQGC